MSLLWAIGLGAFSSCPMGAGVPPKNGEDREQRPPECIGRLVRSQTKTMLMTMQIGATRIADANDPIEHP